MNTSRTIDLPILGGSVEIDSLDFINYSMQINGIKCLRKFILTNKSNTDWHGILVRLTGELIQESQAYISTLPVGKKVSLPELNIYVNGDILSSLSEGQIAHYRIEYIKDEQVLESSSHDIRVMTFNQWCGSAFNPELLAAFITPNHPEVSAILTDVAHILDQDYNNGSICGYLANREGVWTQVEALYKALRQRGLIYSGVPASFELIGQRIRPVEQVLDEKLGTCMDLSLLICSCLEAMSLNPILVLINGHIFPGLYLTYKYYENSICDDLNYLRKGLQDGVHNLIVFEGTAITSKSFPKFEDAVDEGITLLNKDEIFELAIDIHACRLNGIKPMPRRLIVEGKTELINDGLNYIHERSTLPRFNVHNYDDSERQDKVKNPKQLLWERKLLDLSLNNALLNVRLGSSSVQVMCGDIKVLLEALDNYEKFEFLGHLRPQHPDGSNIAYSPWDDNYEINKFHNTKIRARIVLDELLTSLKHHRLHSYARSPEHYSLLKDLYRTSKIAYEENGANSLFLALGFLHWKEVEGGNSYAAPLVLVPVELKRKSLQSYTLELQDSEPQFNITLLEYIYQTSGFRLSGLNPLPHTEEGLIDIDQVLARMRFYIQEQKGWEVTDEVVLGNFSFTKFVMWHDIHSHSEVLEAHPITAMLMHQPESEDNYDDSLITHPITSTEIEQAEGKNLILPLEADSSQIEAIIDAVKGKSFVLHGPPGTGKSQTITNIIANMLYQGKRVLFVAEKMAALEVVQSRMDKIGLGAFCLELHGNKVTKKHFLSQMARVLDSVLKTTNDSGQIMPLWTEERDKILSFTQALHQERELGYSLYDIIMRYESISHPCIAMDWNPQLHHDGTIDQLRRILVQLDTVFQISGYPSEHKLKACILRNPLTAYDRVAIEQSINKLQNLSSDIDLWEEKLAQLVGIRPSGQWDSMQLIGEILSILIETPRFNLHWLKQLDLPNGLTEILHICNQLERCFIEATHLHTTYGSIPQIQSRDLSNRYKETESKCFVFKYASQKSLLKELRHMGLTLEYTKIPQLVEDLARFESERNQLSDASLEKVQNLVHFEEYGSPMFWKDLRQELSSCARLPSLLSELALHQGVSYGELRQTFMSYIGEDWHITLEGRKDTCESYIIYLKKLKKVTMTLDAIFVLPNYSNLQELSECVGHWKEHLSDLRDWAHWLVKRQTLISLGAEVIVQAIEKTKCSMKDLSLSLERTIYRQMIEHIISEDSNLSMFNGLIFEETLRLYRDLSEQLQLLSQDELYSRLVERVPNGLNLQSELSQELAQLKRFIANGGRSRSIRNMMDSIPKLLPRLAPCMLMSPLSVAQYIDMESPKFDLVIFDEASQMPTSEAVGAIARGKALIVVGDPKQMPPTSFFVSQQLTDEDALIDDMESILDDCIALSVPSKHLSWHYRSRHESLIAFSNYSFYDGNLCTFPSTDNQQSKLSLVKVNGVYTRSSDRNNPIEAEAVVMELVTHLQSEAGARQSVGIVAFSQAQQTLIEDKLYNYLHKHPELNELLASLPEPLFIKNLENVQGDERDIILFSIGYGPDDSGKISMNFGPLNNKGGERRLNVAASRAREEMKIFSSVGPEDIDLKRTDSVGVASLKLLLECAVFGTNHLSARLGQLRSPSSMVIELAEVLRSHGYNLDLMVGTSSFRIDIAVHHSQNSQQYLVGIICDGDGYFKTKTVRDREQVRPKVLHYLGWRLLRLWTLDWYNNKQRVISQVLKTLSSMNT